MHIDLFVLGAQIFNFLVLVFILKHFLYNRIVNAMETREGKIVSRFQEAERLKAEAQRSALEYDERNRQLDEKAGELMLQAQKAAEREKELLMDRVREEVDEVRQRWYESLRREKRTFLEGLRRRAGKYVYDTLRNILSEMADEELEERIAQVFIARLRTLASTEGDRLRASLNDGAKTAVVRSAFPLNQGLRTAIDGAVGGYTGGKVPVRYEVSGDIGAGIELRAHGYKLSWSVDDYLSDLEEAFVLFLKDDLGLEARST